MARRTFPNEENRLAYGYTSAGEAYTNKAGSTVTIYTDQAGTILADIQDESSVAVPGSVLTVGADGRIDRFKGPDGTPYGTDLLYAKLQGASSTEPVYARYDDRLDTDTVIRCTSSTRPTSPADGQLIFETDTGTFLFWNSSSSVWVAPQDKYGETTTSVIVNSAAFSAETTLATLNFNGDTTTRFDLKGMWGAATATTATDIFAFRLKLNGNQIAQINRYANTVTAAGVDGGVIEVPLVPVVNGANVLTLTALRVSGAGTMTVLASAVQPIYLTAKEAS